MEPLSSGKSILVLGSGQQVRSRHVELCFPYTAWLTKLSGPYRRTALVSWLLLTLFERSERPLSCKTRERTIFFY